MSFMINVRLRQHEIGPIVGIAVGILAGHVEHTRTTEGGEIVGGSSCGGELGPGGDSTEMINVGGPYVGKVRGAHTLRRGLHTWASNFCRRR
jgi:hypothetical protein